MSLGGQWSVDGESLGEVDQAAVIFWKILYPGLSEPDCFERA